MKNLVIFICLLLSLFSCNSGKDTISTINFTHVKDVELLLDSATLNTPFDFEIVETEDGKCIFYYLSDRFYIYNIEDGRLISKVDFKGLDIWGAKFINYDSIFIQKRDNYDGIFDSTLSLCDAFGNIKKYYSLKNMPLLSSENNFLTYDSTAYFNNFSIIPYNNENIFLSFSKYDSYQINDSAYLSHKIMLGGHLNISENKFYKHNLYNLPDLDSSKIYANNYADLVTTSNYNNSLLYSFWYTPTIYKYDYNTATNEILNIPSYLVTDTFVELESYAYFSKYIYHKVLFWENKNIYLRLVFLRDENRNTAIILDNNLEKIGEALVPKGSRKVFWHNEELYIFNEEKTFASEGKMIFSVYKAELSEILLSEFLEKNKIQETQTSSGNLNNSCNVEQNNNDGDILKLKTYLNQKTGKETYRAFIVPVMESCPSCVQYVLTNYAANKELFSQLGVYLIAVGKNIPVLKQKLQEVGLSTAIPTVIIDQSEIYQQTLGNYANQHLIIVDSNNVIKYEDYPADSLETIIPDMIEGFGLITQ